MSEEDGGKSEAEVAPPSHVQETELDLDDMKEPGDQGEAGLMQVEVEMHEQQQQRHQGGRVRIIIPGSKETDI